MNNRGLTLYFFCHPRDVSSRGNKGSSTKWERAKVIYLELAVVIRESAAITCV